jgi:hypothetical protein
VDFILKSTGGGVQAPAVQYHDPLTGTGYVPPPSGGGSQPAAGASSGAGAGGSGGAFAATGGGADPFTGGGRSAGPRHLPAKAYLVYDQVCAHELRCGGLRCGWYSVVTCGDRVRAGWSSAKGHVFGCAGW